MNLRDIKRDDLSRKNSNSEAIFKNIKFYENVEKIRTQDNFASWISNVLFEEAKKMELLSTGEEQEVDDTTLTLKKRSTFINVATTTNQYKNFTDKIKEYDQSKFVYNNKIYDRRRVSSLISNMSTPMPKEMTE